MTLAKTLVISTAAATCLALQAPVAIADDTGMAGMHDWVKVGRKTCLRDHTHTGNSSGQRTKKQALAAAIKSWQEFTAFEYGTDWAYFKYANAKVNSCSQESSGWTCSVEARPCNRGRRR